MARKERGKRRSLHPLSPFPVNEEEGGKEKDWKGNGSQQKGIDVKKIHKIGLLQYKIFLNMQVSK